MHMALNFFSTFVVTTGKIYTKIHATFSFIIFCHISASEVIWGRALQAKKGIRTDSLHKPKLKFIYTYVYSIFNLSISIYLSSIF
jgi:hypothetical protein